MAHTHLWNRIYEGCLEAAKSLGKDKSKLSWLPKNRSSNALCDTEQQKEAA